MRRMYSMLWRSAAAVLVLIAGADVVAQQSLGKVRVPGVVFEPGDAVDLGLPLLIGPVDGLTSDWHEAPAEEAWICAGTEIVLRQEAPVGARVIWHGEGLVARGDGGREVVCVMHETGVQKITAEVRTGTARQLKACTFRVVHYPHDRVIQGLNNHAVGPAFKTFVEGVAERLWNHPFR